MLIPLTRETFEQLIPAVATSDQYRYFWGKPADLIRRLLVTVVFVLVILLIYKFQTTGFASDGVGSVLLICGIISGLYWLWGPVYDASIKNIKCRRYPYCGFWQGRVLDVYITETVIGEEEKVNSKGQLVVIENREPRLNLEVGDKTGFSTKIQAPLTRNLQGIKPGQAALMIVMSKEPNLSRIALCSDIYIPSRNIWVSDYPYLRRDAFEEVARQIQAEKKARKAKIIDN